MPAALVSLGEITCFLDHRYTYRWFLDEAIVGMNQKTQIQMFQNHQSQSNIP